MRLLEVAKNIDFRQWQEHRIISMLVAISETKKQIPSIVELMEMLRLCSAWSQVGALNILFLIFLSILRTLNEFWTPFM